MAKMTKMKPHELEALVQIHGKGRQLCRDLFGGHIKRATFVSQMIDYPYVDPATVENFVPSSVWPEIPGTREVILDWAVRVQYIEQDVYDEIMEGLSNGK